MPGTYVDGVYRLLAPAGRGGMAEVWRAEHVGDHASRRAVAIKRILPDLANDHVIRGLFDDEARIAATLDHPNIVGFERYGCDATGPYMAMEWIEGVTLAELIAAHAGPLPQGIVVAVALDVLRGLAAAHDHRVEGPRVGGRRAPVIHRDVSPSNVLVTTAGVAKLTDFGLARSLDHARTHPRGTAPGKLAYLPPEVLGRAPHGVRGDLYAVGAVMWEALAARKLFDALPRAVGALLGAARPGIATARPTVEPALATVIDRALSVDPAGRYASAAAMGDALLAAAETCGAIAPAEAVATLVRALLPVDTGAPPVASGVRPKTSFPPPREWTTPDEGLSTLRSWR